MAVSGDTSHSLRPPPSERIQTVKFDILHRHERYKTCMATCRFLCKHIHIQEAQAPGFTKLSSRRRVTAKRKDERENGRRKKN